MGGGGETNVPCRRIPNNLCRYFLLKMLFLEEERDSSLFQRGSAQ